MEPLHVARAELVRQAAELVGVDHLGGAPGGRRQRGDPVLAQIGPVRVAGAPVLERPQAEPAAAGVAEALDLARVDANAPARGLLRPRVGVRRSGVDGRFHRPRGGIVERHEAVPPTVSSRIRTCGCPTPAGTVWPPFPQ